MDEKIYNLLEMVYMELQEVKSDVSTLKSDVSTLKSDVSTLKTDVSTLKSEVEEIQCTMATKEDLKVFATKEDLELVREELQTEIQAVYEEVKLLRNDFQYVEIATAKNTMDISKFKLVSNI
jgi:hypothetical protein